MCPIPMKEIPLAATKVSCRLEDVRVDDRRVTVSASVTLPEAEAELDSLTILAHRRTDDWVVEFETEFEDRTSGVQSLITAARDSLDRGVWDVFVAVGRAGIVEEIRVGSSRSRLLEPEGVSNVDDDPALHERVIAYFTRGAGNLSIDCGAVLHRDVATARSVGLTLDENGRAVLLVETTGAPRPDDEYFCTLDGVPQHGGRHLLPSVQLGPRLVGLRMPLSSETIGATAHVISVHGGARTHLPIVGVEYWPTRAAGFGLAGVDDGGVVVAGAATTARRNDPPSWYAPSARREAGRSPRERARAVVKAVPLLGPTLVRAGRSVRRWRS